MAAAAGVVVGRVLVGPGLYGVWRMAYSPYGRGWLAAGWAQARMPTDRSQ